MQNQAISGRFFALCVFFLASGLLFSQEDGKSLAAKYQVERGQALTSGVAARFPTLLLEKADGFASQGMLALKAGRLTQAAEFFRQGAGSYLTRLPRSPRTSPVSLATCGFGTPMWSVPSPSAPTAPTRQRRLGRCRHHLGCGQWT